MALIKKRPTLSYSIFGEAVGGETLSGELVVKADEKVSIDWLKLTFVGKESTAASQGQSSTQQSIILCGLRWELLGEAEIGPGTHRFPFTLALASRPSAELSQ